MAQIALMLVLAWSLVAGVLCSPIWREIDAYSARAISSGRFAADSIGGQYEDPIYPAFEKEWSQYNYSYKVNFAAYFRDIGRHRCRADVDWRITFNGIEKYLREYYCEPL